MSRPFLTALFALSVFTICNAKIIFTQIIPCKVEPNKIQEGFELSVEYDSAALAASGTLKTPFAIDDSIEFEATGEKFVNGKYEPDYFNMQGGLCDITYMYLPAVAASFARALNVTDLCPLPAGEYKLDNFSINAEEVDIPDSDGEYEYMLNMMYKKDGIPVVCYKFGMKMV